MNKLEQDLIKHLSNAEFHSGEQLRTTLNVSRTRIHQAVQGLRTMGLNINAVKGRGYRVFGGIDLLNADTLQETFPELDIAVLQTTPSTNDYCLQHANSSLKKPRLCLAEQQTQGRGRQAKAWQSPFASNIYLSLLQKFEKPVTEMSGLTLAVGVCIAELLKQTSVQNIALKWPNDVYVDGAKIAGILTEVVGDALGPSYVVIGIGLNVNMPAAAGEHIEQAWTDCSRVCPHKISRTQWASQLTRQLLHTLASFEQYGLAAFLPLWQQYDYLAGRTLTVQHAGKEITTQAQGITEQGYLKIADAPHQLASADILALS